MNNIDTKYDTIITEISINVKIWIPQTFRIVFSTCWIQHSRYRSLQDYMSSVPFFMEDYTFFIFYFPKHSAVQVCSITIKFFWYFSLWKLIENVL